MADAPLSPVTAPLQGGSTEEKLRLKILGCRRRGRKQDGPFDHSTGKGWVERTKGDYYDAIHVKKGRVIPMITETFGGIAPHSVNQVSRLAERTRGRRARDSTHYGASRTAHKDFFVHWTNRLGFSAQIGDVRAILKNVAGRKQQLIAGRLASGATCAA